jgi:hypothetical protein
MSILVWTSLYLLTNSIVAYHRDYMLYAFLFLFLTITSVVNHATHHPLINSIDKMAVYAVAIYGAYHIYSRSSWNQLLMLLVIISTFLVTLVLYEYGLRHSKYCFDPDPLLSQMYHGYMHIIGSIGHHLVMCL